MDGRILATTVELLRERGLVGLRIDHVAQRAKVPKSTVYRRWPSLTDLAIDALAAMLQRPDLAPGDDPRADLRRIVELTYVAFVETPLGAALPQLGLELAHSTGAAAYRATMIDPLREAALAAIARGNDAGLWSIADPSAAVDMVAGALLYRVVVLQERPSGHEVESFARMLGVDLDPVVEPTGGRITVQA
jgi:AcrR family transcriptional regulator